MKALLLTAPSRLEFTDFPQPQPGPGEVLLRIRACGICGVIGTCGSAGEYPLCLDLIARGVIRVEPMITAVAPLAEGAAWFERLSAKDGGKHMKVILEP